MPPTTPSPQPTMPTDTATILNQLPIIILFAVLGIVILVLIMIAIVIPILITKVFLKKRKKTIVYLEELSAQRGTPDPDHENHYHGNNYHGNNYISRSKLFQGNICAQ